MNDITVIIAYRTHKYTNRYVQLKMTNNISVHIGKAGCQIGETLWELYCMENGIDMEGNIVNPNTEHLHRDTTFFTKNANNIFTPNAVFIDLGLDCIKSNHSKLYKYRNIISCTQNGFSNTFATGYLSGGQKVIESIMEQLRIVCEQCDGKKIFWIFNSLNGGTSSGLGNLVIDEINKEYKSSKYQIAILPDTNSMSTLECYNSTLSFSKCIDSVDMNLFFSNKKITQILQQDSQFHSIPFTNINRHICIALSCLTSNSRQTMDVNINDQIGVNVYPRMHYPLIGYYPTSNIHRLNTDSPSVKELTISCFDNRNIVTDMDPSFGLYINTNMFYRGNVLIHDVINSVKHIGAGVELLDWTPAGLKIFYSDHSRFISPERDLIRVDRAVCMLSQHTIFKEYLKGLSDKFSKVFRGKDQIELYTKEGMEELEFCNAKENIDSLIQDFEDLI